jgi:DNA repair protein RadD
MQALSLEFAQGLTPRPYQTEAIEKLYQWFSENLTGNPCLIAPTGSGKSILTAMICKDALKWHGTKVLMMSHVKEIIEQNAKKLMEYWPNAPLGVYCAALKRKELGNPITFGTINSLLRQGEKIGHIDLVIIDEAHRVSHKNEGGYRRLINHLMQINPGLRVIGLTATPFRLGHGTITNGDNTLFDDLIETVTIPELLAIGALAPLRSKHTGLTLDVSGVGTSKGDYKQDELQAAVDTEDNNQAIVQEMIERGRDRLHWMVFCTGVDHVNHITDLLNQNGVSAVAVTGELSTLERDFRIKQFTSGQVKALVNCEVLTTGFDFCDVDLLALLRPTKSVTLYLQICGRGMRIKSHIDDCLVLDFAGLVATHGPVTNPYIKEKRPTKGDGTPPTRVCNDCGEICHAAAKECSHCGFLFPEPEKKEFHLDADADIMGDDLNKLHELTVRDWTWRVQQSKSNGRDMLKVTYYGQYYSDPPITEFLCVLHDSGIAQKHMRILNYICNNSGVDVMTHQTLDELANALNSASPPSAVEYKINGKYQDIKSRIWPPF